VIADNLNRVEVAFSVGSEARAQAPRVRVFVDYWNFQLSLDRKEAEERGVRDYRFYIDWAELGPWLAMKACATIRAPQFSFDGVIIYTSSDPRTEAGARFRRWVMTWLNLQPGVAVECEKRKPKAPPTCPECREQIIECPHCRHKIAATEEKGVDTLIATDMIRLAWEDSYDFAVLATSDRDLIPAVKFLGQKGRRVIQAGFPPLGADLARACWASFDVYSDREEILRKATAVGSTAHEEDASKA
jgi:uncharacterized LabA/DUF88 family protein